MVKRVSFFAYGLVCYVVFLFTFLYAIAFVGGFAPTGLDGEATMPLALALAIDAGLLTLFAVQHSVMARRWFKDWWTTIVSPVLERSTYVLCASLALIVLFWQWQPLGGEVWSIDHPAARAALLALFGLGWLQVLVVTFLIDHFDLFGLRQVWLFLVGKPYTRAEFVTPAPYRVVRHPLYLGFLLAFWMTPTMTLAHLVFAVATTAYIVIAIQFEERDLMREHGQAYLDYRRRVPMLLPGLIRGAVRRREEAALAIVALVCSWPAWTAAQEHHASASRQGKQVSAFVAEVREATRRFQDSAVALAEGYVPQFGCVSGSHEGAMGVHFVNFPMVADAALDVARPELLVYEPLPDGRLRLVAADYLVLTSSWHASNQAPPELMGQLFHLFESPNRFGLPEFYTLHVWAWKENPQGTFANWNPNVSCDGYNPN